MKETRIEKASLIFMGAGSLLLTAAAIGSLVYLLVIFASLVTPPAFGQSSAAVRLEGGFAKEEVDGDLRSAIDIYQKIAADASAPRDVRSKALLRLAGCYEKLGQQATQIYEQVVRDFADQPAATQARNRIAALRTGVNSGPSTMTQRKIELPLASTLTYKGPNKDVRRYVGLSIFPTDGQRVIYKDAATGVLTIGDLAGRDQRVILKPKTGEQIENIFPSRDFSSVLVWLRVEGGRKQEALKTDGTGYREMADMVLDLSKTPDGGVISSDCGPSDWSWDNRYVFECRMGPDRSAQVRRVSVTDGEVRNLGRPVGPVNRPSPDGRFLASTSEYERAGKVWIMPIAGGEPEVVSEDAHLIDWTRDGRYLIITSSRSGSEALYLLPVKDGKAAGNPVFVHYGPCFFGSAVGTGGLVCHYTHPNDGLEAWLGSLWVLENFEPKQ